MKTGCLLPQEAPTFNASMHRGGFLGNGHRLVGTFLPPYSPKLNPIERVFFIVNHGISVLLRKNYLFLGLTIIAPAALTTALAADLFGSLSEGTNLGILSMGH